MKLINADKLHYEDGRDMVPTGKYVTKEDIDSMPAVDAIPVSFLEGLRDNARSVEASDRIQEIIDLWDEELKVWN